MEVSYQYEIGKMKILQRCGHRLVESIHQQTSQSIFEDTSILEVLEKPRNSSANSMMKVPL